MRKKNTFTFDKLFCKRWKQSIDAIIARKKCIGRTGTSKGYASF